MRIALRRSGKRGELNLTTMMDVTFLLLVFFILTAQFAPNEGIIPADLPSHGITQPSPPIQVGTPVVIHLRSTGDDCVIRLDSGRNEIVRDFQSLFQRLDAWRYDAATNPNGFLAADHLIVIQSTPTTRWQHVVDAMNACVRAKYQCVNFAAAYD